MAILETITDGLCSAKNAIVDVAQDVVEKSHQKAQLNRLRSIMKKKTKLWNRPLLHWVRLFMKL